jgi:TDG/mug DNA glycosylase family protein
MNPVSDIIDFELKILFIGFNPGIRSSETGHHFAGPSNRFWRLLYESGLTDVKLKPENERQLLQYGYGITNIVPRPTRAASEIAKFEYDLGRNVLKQKLESFQPRIACYVGIGVYQRFAQRQNICCGLQSESVVDLVIDFVVSSSSGLNRIPLTQQLNCFIDLRRLLKK